MCRQKNFFDLEVVDPGGIKINWLTLNKSCSLKYIPFCHRANKQLQHDKSNTEEYFPGNVSRFSVISHCLIFLMSLLQ